MADGNDYPKGFDLAKLPLFLQGAKEEFEEGVCPEELEESLWWTFSTLTGRECTKPTESASEFLKWVISQVILGNYEPKEDSDGFVTSLLIGRETAYSSSKKEALTESFKRLILIKCARLAIRAKVIGDIGHQSEPLNYLAQNLGDKQARAVVELARAQDLASTLGSFAKKLIDVEAPASLRLPRGLAALMEEAMECYLHRYFLAAVTLCRTCLESSLEHRLTISGLTNRFEQQIAFQLEEQKKKPGRLLRLIDFIAVQEKLGNGFSKAAHYLRTKTNDAIHGKVQVTAPFAGEMIHQARTLVRILFPPA